MQFIGERENEGLCPCPPLKPFLKEGFKNPKNFQKLLFANVFLKVLGDPRTFFQKGSWPPEAAPPLPDKPKFEIRLNRYAGKYYRISKIFFTLLTNPPLCVILSP